MIHSPEVTQKREGHAVPYLLRGWIWCAVCDRLMVPALVSSGKRHYGCPDRECPRPLISAEKAERLVWAHFAYLNQASADEVVPEGRREALRHVLAKVWIGVDVYHIYFDWRD